jgi:hypothetical protein
MLVYLDNCCFNRPFDDQSQMRVRLETEAKLAIQAEVRDGAVRLGWSYILDFENDSNPSEERKENIKIWRNFASVDTTESPEILSVAVDLVSQGFRKMDSLHLASAMALQWDIFLTTDDGILKKRSKVDKIKILNPVEYYAKFTD